MAAAGRLPSRLDLDAVQGYATPATERVGLLRLDVNEHAEGVPAEIVAAIAASLTDQSIATYPHYAAWHLQAGAYYGVAPDEVTCTAGGDEAIKAICECFLMPGKALAMPVPGFDLFALWARLYGGVLREVPLGPGFALDGAAWFAALDSDVGLAVLTSPNNPTGTLVPLEFVEETLRRTTCPVIVDETYVEFAGPSAARLVSRYPHLFVVRSFSKVHGLAGLRIGAVLSQAQNITELRKVLPPFNVSRPAVVASQAAMQRPDILHRHVADIAAARGEFAAALLDMAIPVGPQTANFVLAYFGSRAQAVVSGLAAEGILVRDRSAAHPTLRGWVRIGIGSRAQMLRAAAAVRKLCVAAPRLDALLFDMDGPLVDTANSYRAAIAQTARILLARYGKAPQVLEQVTPAAIERLKRKGGLNNDWDCTHALIAELGGTVPYDQVVETFQAIYWGDDGDGLLAGEPFLVDAQLRARIAARLRTGIVTGRPRAEALETLRRNHAHDLWPPELVVAMEDGPNKPAPDGIRHLMSVLGVAASATAYVGDSVDDMRAAKAAGVWAIGVLPATAQWNDGLCERLAEAGADVVFASVAEVVSWLSA